MTRVAQSRVHIEVQGRSQRRFREEQLLFIYAVGNFFANNVSKAYMRRKLHAGGPSVLSK